MSAYAAIDYWLLERANPSCKPDFHFETTILVKVYGNKLCFKAWQKYLSKLVFWPKFKPKNSCKIWHFDRFLSIFRQRVNRKPRNLVLCNFILSSSQLIWSFTTGHLSVNSVRSVQRKLYATQRATYELLAPSKSGKFELVDFSKKGSDI